MRKLEWILGRQREDGRTNRNRKTKKHRVGQADRGRQDAETKEGDEREKGGDGSVLFIQEVGTPSPSFVSGNSQLCTYFTILL